MNGPAEVARAYFAAIAARDPEAVRRVFAPDGELVTMAGRVSGPDAIADFYAANAFGFDDLEPRPGPFVVDGDRVAVEIELRMGGHTTPVADFFTIRDGLVRRLVVYLGPSV